MSSQNNFKTFYAISFAWQLGFIIAIPIAGFIFLGFIADGFLSTQPVLLITGFIVGVIITVYEIYHMLIPIIKNKND